MNPRKRFRQHDARAEVAGLKGSVFARAAFAVVVFGHDEPFFALAFPLLRELRDGVPSEVAAGIEVVVSDVRFAGGGVGGADEGVGADVGEVAFEF